MNSVTVGQVIAECLQDLRNELEKRWSVNECPYATALHNTILNDTAAELGNFIGKNALQPITPDLQLNNASKDAILEHYKNIIYPLFLVNPSTKGKPIEMIDDIDGYLRDPRVYDEQSEVARNGLRLSFKQEDTTNLFGSTIPQQFSAAYLGKTDPQIEHVLEISIVAHMINSPKFIEKIEKEFKTPHYLSPQPFSGLDTLAQLAETLKQKENLVKDVPQNFNLHKANFFQGNSELDIPLALYLEERSKIQKLWIEGNCNHENPYVKFVFGELLKTRFAQGNWYQLIGDIWFMKLESHGAFKGQQGIQGHGHIE